MNCNCIGHIFDERPKQVMAEDGWHVEGYSAPPWQSKIVASNSSVMSTVALAPDGFIWVLMGNDLWFPSGDIDGVPSIEDRRNFVHDGETDGF